MERAMDEIFGMRPISRRLPQEREWMPSVEMFEKDNNYIIKAELPGVKQEDIDVTVTDHSLIIRGEKQASKETKKEDYYLSEVSYGSFMRSIPLPENVDVDKVEASFSQGTLELTVPKMALTQPKKVAISAKKSEKEEMKAETGEKTSGRTKKATSKS